MTSAPLQQGWRSCTTTPRRAEVRLTVVAEQLVRPIPGGLGTYTRQLLDGLFELQSTAGGPPIDLEIRLSRGLKASEVGEPPEPWRAAIAPWPTPRTLTQQLVDLGWLRCGGGASVLHATTLGGPRPGRPRPGRVSAMVADLSFLTSPGTTTARGRRWHLAALERARQDCDLLFTLSEQSRQALVRSGIAEDQIAVVTMAPPAAVPGGDAAAESLLDTLAITGDFLLSVSTAEPRKNLARLLTARERSALARELPLVVIGPTGWGSSGLELPSPGVHLAGRVPTATLQALYRRARLLCYIPLEEGFGLPPLEALAQGTPVLASTAVPSVNDGVATRVDPFDLEAIAAGLDHALSATAAVEQQVAVATSTVGARTPADLAAAHLEHWMRHG